MNKSCKKSKNSVTKLGNKKRMRSSTKIGKRNQSRVRTKKLKPTQSGGHKSKVSTALGKPVSTMRKGFKRLIRLAGVPKQPHKLQVPQVATQLAKAKNTVAERAAAAKAVRTLNDGKKLSETSTINGGPTIRLKSPEQSVVDAPAASKPEATTNKLTQKAAATAAKVREQANNSVSKQKVSKMSVKKMIEALKELESRYANPENVSKYSNIKSDNIKNRLNQMNFKNLNNESLRSLLKDIKENPDLGLGELYGKMQRELMFRAVENSTNPPARPTRPTRPAPARQAPLSPAAKAAAAEAAAKAAAAIDKGKGIQEKLNEIRRQKSVKSNVNRLTKKIKGAYLETTREKKLEKLRERLSRNNVRVKNLVDLIPREQNESIKKELQRALVNKQRGMSIDNIDSLLALKTDPDSRELLIDIRYKKLKEQKMILNTQRQTKQEANIQNKRLTGKEGKLYYAQQQFKDTINDTIVSIDDFIQKPYIYLMPTQKESPEGKKLISDIKTIKNFLDTFQVGKKFDIGKISASLSNSSKFITAVIDVQKSSLSKSLPDTFKLEIGPQLVTNRITLQLKEIKKNADGLEAQVAQEALTRAKEVATNINIEMGPQESVV